MEKGTIEFSLGANRDLTGRWPLRLAILGEFLPRAYETGKPDDRFFRSVVDKDTFHEVMAQAKLRLQLDLKNPLGEIPKELHLDFNLADFKAFRPETIAGAIPELADLLETRKLLGELTFRKITVEAFKQKLDPAGLPAELTEKITAAIQPPQKKVKTAPAPTPENAPTPKRSTDTESALDSILDMVDTGESEQPSADAKRRVQAAISDFVGSGTSAGTISDTAAAQKASAYADRLIGKAINAVMHHPEFQRLEAIWSGLKFLVDRTDFRKGVILEVINCPKEKFAETFAEKIYPVEYDAQSNIPLTAVIGVYEFDAHAPDIDQLRDLSSKAADIPVAVVTSLGASFFGLDNTAKLVDLPLLTTLLESPEFAKYDGLRKEDTSRWLGLTFNRFLLRDLYGKDGLPVKGFEFAESAAEDSHRLWGNPVWAVAVTMTRSQARIGWPTDIAGPREGALDNLPVRPFTLTNGEEVNFPLEAPVPDRRLEEFDRCGIIPLLCDINSDTAYLLAAPSVHRPLHDSDTRQAEQNAFLSSLAYQLYAGEIARFINRKLAEWTAGVGGDIAAYARKDIAAFNVARDNESSPGRVQVNIDEVSGQKILAISIHSPREVLHGRAEVQMGIPLRR